MPLKHNKVIMIQGHTLFRHTNIYPHQHIPHKHNKVITSTEQVIQTTIGTVVDSALA